VSKVVCSKCGATGISKCPFCRQVFPDNQSMAMWRAVSAFEFEPSGKYNTPDLVLRLTYHAANEEEAEALKRGELTTDQLEFMKDAIEARMRDNCADHEWGFAAGEKSSIGCGHTAEGAGL
jgi:hypothetical protein